MENFAKDLKVPILVIIENSRISDNPDIIEKSYTKYYVAIAIVPIVLTLIAWKFATKKH